jgi:hypothetical protein
VVRETLDAARAVDAHVARAVNVPGAGVEDLVAGKWLGDAARSGQLGRWLRRAGNSLWQVIATGIHFRLREVAA